MATGRAAIFEGIYQVLVEDPFLVPGLLGPRTVENQRLYRGFPQQAPTLAGYEPQPNGEGWLVIEEPQPGLRAAMVQLDTAEELIDVHFHIFATLGRTSIAEAVMDVLDSYWEWTVEQMRDVVYGDRFLLFARRFEAQELYAQDVKLFHKLAKFRMRFMRAVLFP